MEDRSAYLIRSGILGQWIRCDVHARNHSIQASHIARLVIVMRCHAQHGGGNKVRLYVIQLRLVLICKRRERERGRLVCIGERLVHTGLTLGLRIAAPTNAQTGHHDGNQQQKASTCGAGNHRINGIMLIIDSFLGRGHGCSGYDGGQLGRSFWQRKNR